MGDLGGSGVRSIGPPVWSMNVVAGRTDGVLLGTGCDRGDQHTSRCGDLHRLTEPRQAPVISAVAPR